MRRARDEGVDFHWPTPQRPKVPLDLVLYVPSQKPGQPRVSFSGAAATLQSLADAPAAAAPRGSSIVRAVHRFRDAPDVPRIYTLSASEPLPTVRIHTMDKKRSHEFHRVRAGPVHGALLAMRPGTGRFLLDAAFLRVQGTLSLDTSNTWLHEDRGSGAPCLGGVPAPVSLNLAEMTVQSDAVPASPVHLAVETVSLHTRAMRMFRAFNEPGAAPLVWRRGGPTTQLMTTCDAGVFDMAPRRAPLLVDVGRGTGLVLCAGYTVALELQFGMRCYRGADAPPPPYKIASTWFDLCPDTGAVYDGHLPVRSIELDLHCGIVVATYDAGATETVTESALHCRIMTVTETRSETRRAKVQRLDKAIVCAPDIVLLAGRIDMPNGTTHSTMCIDAASGTVLVAGDSAPATFVAIGGA